MRMTRADSTTSSSSTTTFQETMSRLVSGVAVVTTATDTGEPCGLLVTSLSSYSAAPPSLTVNIGRSSRSSPSFNACRKFAVHIMSKDQLEVARTFADRSTDKFSSCRWHWHSGVPRLDGALGFLLCTTARVFSHGDHSILIGNIESGHVVEGAPLIYFRREMSWQLQQRDPSV